jgi:hypothetical protein
VDLRPDAVVELGLGELPSVRSTERRRLVLEPCQGRFALEGCVYLEWGERVSAEPLAPGEHLGLLTAQRRVAGLGANVDQLLGLSGLPAFRLSRPRAHGWMDATRGALVEAVEGGHSYFSPTPRPSART